MTLACWRWLGAVKNQTACLNGKMSQLKKNSPEPVRCKALFAAAFLLACNSRSFARLHRLEAAYHRQYNRALAALLKLRESLAFSNEPDSAPPSAPPAEKNRPAMNELRFTTAPNRAAKSKPNPNPIGAPEPTM
jgi:hypothetical protein